jgi:hypothetical protein
MRASASRREQTPARAICLAMRAGALPLSKLKVGLSDMPLV